jgi:hypothetical protein
MGREIGKASWGARRGAPTSADVRDAAVSGELEGWRLAGPRSLAYPALIVTRRARKVTSIARAGRRGDVRLVAALLFRARRRAQQARREQQVPQVGKGALIAFADPLRRVSLGSPPRARSTRPSFAGRSWQSRRARGSEFRRSPSRPAVRCYLRGPPSWGSFSLRWRLVQ